MSKTLILIPSRLSATRLPGKPLLKINNLSIISHVVKKAKESKIGEVYVAAEDQEIVDDVRKNGGQAILTSNHHKTGTDRIFECFKKINLKNVEYIINLQGDEPNIEIDDIIKLKNLTVPHPHIQDRKFILRPLCDIAANLKHPIIKKDMKELLECCTDKLKVITYVS